MPLAERYAAAAATRSAGSSPCASPSAGCAPSAAAGRAALTNGAGARECLTEGPLLSRSAAGAHAHAGARLPKEAVLMQALDQHSRGRVPGCTLYKPRGGAQVALEPAPPTRATTWGAASQQALRWWVVAAGGKGS